MSEIRQVNVEKCVEDVRRRFYHALAADCDGALIEKWVDEFDQCFKRALAVTRIETMENSARICERVAGTEGNLGQAASLIRSGVTLQEQPNERD